MQTIQYDHIPTQTLIPKAEEELLKINLKKEGNVIGYIRGAGDDVPSGLRNMGYEVWEMKTKKSRTPISKSGCHRAGHSCVKYKRAHSIYHARFAKLCQGRRHYDYSIQYDQRFGN